MNTITRRTLLTGATAAAVAITTLPLLAQAAVMTAPEAQKAALAGEVVFIDIRSPEEWKETGLATSASPVSMHQAGFLQKLDKLIDGDKTRKIAIICATGARSAFIQKELTKRGYTNAISVAEGMLGGPYGKGWIPRGMPVKQFTGN
ncbi:hypothetical protein MNBD_ALPHA08-1847 [hydrothermal vent metagenome]|uniref:Rhodanese domain-containing protein n=1 Tax=hydrothermal vent metagenome TaxID=652676 RepID=A0A3B0S952_9ZZZZ